MKPDQAAILLLLSILFLPSFLDVYNIENPNWFSIIALLWRVLIERVGTLEFNFTVFYPFAYLHYFFIKYLLVYQLFRFKRNLTTRRRVIILGIISELQMFLMSEVPKIINMFQNSINWTSFTWTLPIPITLVICILLIFTAPKPDSELSWLENEQKKSWWRRKGVHLEFASFTYESKLDLVYDLKDWRQLWELTISNQCT